VCADLYSVFLVGFAHHIVNYRCPRLHSFFKSPAHVQEGGFTGVVPCKYTHLDLSRSQLCDEDLLVLATAMYKDFVKIPGLVRVNRLLQVHSYCPLGFFL
jgi:hypothetical protein